MEKININIKKSFGSFDMDVSFSSSARRIGILGASGCGKSQTLKMIAGIAVPSEGKITYEDKVLFSSSDKINIPPQKRNTGYLFQSYALFPNMTVSQNICSGIKNAKEKETILKEMLSLFHLEGLEGHYPDQLSGGQAQRTALARVFAYHPSLLLLDEPFSALDYHLKDVMQEELLEILDGYGGQTILVSHDRDEIYKFCDEIIVMDEGRVISCGETLDIFRNPKNKRTAELSGCKNFSRIEKKDDFHAYAPDWGTDLEFAQKIPEKALYVGIRAHDIVPLWEDTPCDNTVPFNLKNTARLPFETHFYICCPKGQICWFIQRDREKVIGEKGMPQRLHLPPESLIPLE